MSKLSSGSILVWRFSDAPEDFRALSDNGGDEDWLVFIPEHMAEEVLMYGVPSWIAATGCCSLDEFKISTGTVFIGSHA